MVDSPKEFLKKCEEGKIYLPSYANEFFKDGSGIFHVLSECIINNISEDYIKIMNMLLLKEHKLNLFQQIGRKQSAFFLLKEAANKDGSLIEVLNGFLLNLDNLNKTDSYLISSFITDLGKKGKTLEIEKIFNKFPEAKTNGSIVYSLFKTSLERNDEKLLDLLLSNKEIELELSKKVASLKFNYEKQYNATKNINAYGYAIYYGSEKVLNKLISHFGKKIKFNGKMESNEISTNTLEYIPHPLTIALENKNIPLFENYYSKMDYADKAEWIAKVSNINIVNYEKINKKIIDELPTIFGSKEVLDTNKLSIFISILRMKSAGLEKEKFQIIEKIAEPLWELLPPVGKASVFMGSNSFFNNFYSKGDMSNEEINSFVNIFKKIVEYGHFEIADRTFSNSFFNEPNLAKKLIEAGMNLRTQPTTRYIMEGTKAYEFNIYEIFINHYKTLKQESSTNKKVDSLDLEKAKETLQVIYNHNKELLFNPISKGYSVLQFAMENNCREIFEIISVEDFKEFKTRYGESMLQVLSKIYSHSEEGRKSFDVCLNKLMEADFDMSARVVTTYSNFPLYYTFFDRVNDFSLLDKLMNKIGANIDSDIQSNDFWSNFKTNHAAQYVKDRITIGVEDRNAKKIMLGICSSNYNEDRFQTITDIFPDIYKTKFLANENILHTAIKEQIYGLAQLIVKKYPNLAIEANKQNKMPVSYMMVNFSKTIEKASGYNTAYYEMQKHRELFQNLMEVGLNSINKKANDFLESQLEKYKSIEKAFPEIIKEYYFHKMNKSLNKNEIVKEKKMKI